MDNWRSITLNFCYVHPTDVLSTWSGIQPLANDPYERNSQNISRDHVVCKDYLGLVTITHGRNNFQQKKVQWNLSVIIYGLCISLSYTRLAKRALLILRPTSPKSPVASTSAFESVEGSDEDVDVIENENANLDAGYLHTN
nr:glycerol-3-phosphate dehydrogenase SDP6, mitochondrial [Tanacetum cinerariifolium]